MSKIKTFKEYMANESMVAGDSDGDPVKIASGETSGSVIGNPSKSKKPKKDKEDDKE